MKVLVVGASGATGRLLVKELVEKGHQVKAVVRSLQNIPTVLQEHKDITFIQETLLELNDASMQELVQGCDAIASCLGHNLSFKGVYGKPRRLVRDAVQRLFEAVEKNAPHKPVRLVLMNTTGNRNKDLSEPISFAQHCVLALIRLLLPPHVDNEQAAEFLRTQVKKENAYLEWVAVRPDGLIDEESTSEYEVYASPIRSAIFDAGKTSRINVASFMAKLIYDDALWQKHKGSMPVIYNKNCP